MKVVTHVLTALIAAALVVWFVMSRFPAIMEERAVMELVHATRATEKCLATLSSRIERQLGAFGTAVADDRDFAMKLIVEQDTAASEVAGIAARYMEPMAFDVLEITTAGRLILSSGHFPARAGESESAREALDTDRAVCVFENVRGEEILTYQAATTFELAEQNFHCSGGVIVNEELLLRLTPRTGVRVILRQGAEVSGFGDVETMSEIEDNRIIINDTTYLASAIPLSAAESVEPLELIVLMEEPARLSPLDLL
jgi:hypothetical protein